MRWYMIEPCGETKVSVISFHKCSTWGFSHYLALTSPVSVLIWNWQIISCAETSLTLSERECFHFLKQFSTNFLGYLNSVLCDCRCHTPAFPVVGESAALQNVYHDTNVKNIWTIYMFELIFKCCIIKNCQWTIMNRAVFHNEYIQAIL